MINKIRIEPGDLFLIDSNKTGPKIVKFFMTAPSIFCHIWRKIRGTQEKVLYYHVGIFISPGKIRDQQAKVRTVPSDKVLNTSDRLFIARRRHLSLKQKASLVEQSQIDVGQGYDVLNCFGKFFTWLTGIKWFARHVEWPNAEICVNRGAHWYREGIGEKFGVKYHSELTTHMIYKYIKAHLNEWQIIFEGVPANDKG